MIKKYILIIVIFLVFIFSTTILYGNDITLEEVKEVFNNEIIGDTKIKQTKEENENTVVEIYYPETKYKNLNEYILNKIYEEKENFFELVNQIGYPLDNSKFNLNITFSQYEYKSYISFAFDALIDLGGAHPTNYFFTVIYDTNLKEVITIQDLLQKDSEFLNRLSKEAYEILKNKESIKEYSDEENLQDGLKPIISNFENMVFDKNKLIVFINAYQVAPYVAGSFEVKLSYDKIFPNGM